MKDKTQKDELYNFLYNVKDGLKKKKNREEKKVLFGKNSWKPNISHAVLVLASLGLFAVQEDIHQKETRKLRKQIHRNRVVVNNLHTDIIGLQEELAESYETERNLSEEKKFKAKTEVSIRNEDTREREKKPVAPQHQETLSDTKSQTSRKAKVITAVKGIVKPAVKNPAIKEKTTEPIQESRLNKSPFSPSQSDELHLGQIQEKKAPYKKLVSKNNSLLPIKTILPKTVASETKMAKSIAVSDQ